jgi:glucose-1-phosphate thymidylyltransferase
MQYLIDTDKKTSGEYQLTEAMENMKQKGFPFYTDQVEEWLDCGNKDATLYTLERVLAIKQDTENLHHPSCKVENSVIIEPCYFGENTHIEHSVIGPYVSIESGAKVSNSVLRNSIIGCNSNVKNSVMRNTLLGNSVNCQSNPDELSLGDYSVKK